MAMAQHPGFHRILAGHDGTAAADAALLLAQQLAADDAALLVARVASEPRLALAHGHEQPERERAEAGLAGVELPASGFDRVETRVVGAHSVPHALTALAAEEGADLIVVGSDRRPGDFRAHKVMGLRLLQGAPCAVAIASADGDPAIHHIGVGYDGSTEAELALDAAYAIAERTGAAMTLFYAVLPDARGGLHGQLAHRDAGALLDAAAERAPDSVNPGTVVVSGYACSALVARAHTLDLLVLGSRRQGPLLHAILGSTSRAVAVEVACAVLITPRAAAKP
jgi:nucleotide-binding universal stress UspA family protein